MQVIERKDPAGPLPKGEVFGTFGGYGDLPTPLISYGLPFNKAIVQHVRANARVYVLASPTLCEKTESLMQLKSALGRRFCGVRLGMSRHTLFSECLEVTAEAKRVNADTIVTLGAGSLADAAKFICCALTNDFQTVADLEAAAIKAGATGTLQKTELKPTNISLIMIPTSLSAGEHTPYAGITDGSTGRKFQIATRIQGAITILDPWLATHTPLNLWLQSGVRGIDHGVEHACSSNGTPEATLLCTRGLMLLIPGLLATIADERDVRARLNAQLGVAMTITPLLWGVWAGASHAIGHMLGPMGVGHGETSCILLPAVCRYNASANGDRQARVAAALCRIDTVAELLSQAQLNTTDPDDKRFNASRSGDSEIDPDTGADADTSSKPNLADILDIIIRNLGMPRTLREKGIVGQAQLDRLADNSLQDPFLSTNPIPITDREQVLQILRAVEG